MTRFFSPVIPLVVMALVYATAWSWMTIERYFDEAYAARPSSRLSTIKTTIYPDPQCTDDYVHVWPARNGICRLEDKR